MFQRKYKDAGEDWQEVTESEVRYRLQDWYQSVDLAIDTIKQGIPHDTPFAIFRWIE
jgi:hypothetical protein